MDVQEYAEHDATALAELVRTGQVHPRDLAEAAVAAIERVNGTLNGVIEVYDDALDQPDAGGETFAGVPFLRKDIGATEQGRLVEMGSRLCEGMVAPRDAFYTQRARAGGLRFLGRTTTSEFGLHGTTETLACGATRNPWNPELIAGGSSGGAAAMVEKAGEDGADRRPHLLSPPQSPVSGGRIGAAKRLARRARVRHKRRVPIAGARRFLLGVARRARRS